MSKSLQEKIKEIRAQDDGESEIEPAEYENLILDEIPVERLTAEDKTYLEQFTTLERFCLNQTQLKSLENLPKSDKLEYLELAENQLSGAELKHLTIYANSLVGLKLANNKVASFEDLEPLKKLTKLATLDLEGNPVARADGYTQKLFELLPHLQVLDNHDREGNSKYSDEEEDYGDEDGENQPEFLSDDDYGLEGGFEGGEDDLDDDYDNENQSDAGKNKRAKH
jgi:hypothetical protein